MRAEAEYVSL